MPLSFELTERLHQGRAVDVHRGVLDDGCRIVAKVLKDAVAAKADRDRFREEYALLESLRVEGVTRAVALVEHTEGLAILTHDLGGLSLRRLAMGRPLALPVFLEFAEGICRALGGLHGAGWLHNRLCPSNIVVNIGTRKLELIDLGLATPIREADRSQRLPDPGRIGLAYSSPERTGRMDRIVDHRSDLYSLGVTFYEMLSGHLPFDLSDPVALVHAHVARRPAALSGKGIPDVLSRLVARLLEKNPDDRYESVLAVEADLATCRHHLAAHGSLAGVELGGGAERARPLLTPTSLVGRERELGLLDELYSHAQGTGRSVLVLRGPQGMGKSTLLSHFSREVIASGGVFVESRFSSSRDAVPYGALGQALTRWCQLVAALPEAERDSWRERLGDALGSDAGLLAEVVPDLELALGQRLEPQSLAPELRLRRLRHLLGRFIVAAPSRMRPLVVALDDAQWADLSSMRVLLDVLQHLRPEYFLLIVAMRDGSETRSTRGFLDGLEAASGWQGGVHELRPLTQDGVEELLRQSLGTDSCEGLARLVHEKTAGTPHFVRELLQRLVREQIIRFDERSRGWSWELAGVEVSQNTDNVGERLAARIHEVGLLDKEVLRYGACFGEEFALDEVMALPMCAIYGADELMLAALRLVGLGLILSAPWDGRFQFAHPRVLQEALALIPSEERRAVDVQVARVLLEVQSRSWGERLGAAIERINSMEAALTDPLERQRAAELNLRAGRLAMQSGAHRVAETHFAAGLQFLPSGSWVQAPLLTRELHEAASRAALCVLDHAAVDRLGSQIDRHCTEPMERLERGLTQIQSRAARGQLRAAREAARSTLSSLGLELGTPASSGSSWLARRWKERRWRVLTPGRVRTLEASEDVQLRAMGRVVDALLPVLLVEPLDRMGDLLEPILHRVLAEGQVPMDSLLFLPRATLLAARGEVMLGVAIGAAVLERETRDGQPVRVARAQLWTQLLLNWRGRPLRGQGVSVWTAVAELLSLDDRPFAALAVSHGLALRLLSGAHLERLVADLAWGESTLARLGDELSQAVVASLSGLLAQLRQGAEGEGTAPLDTAGLEQLEEAGNGHAWAMICGWRGLGALLSGEVERAVAELRRATEGGLLHAFGVGPLFRFYFAVALLQRPQFKGSDRRLVEQVVQELSVLGGWNPSEYGPRVELLRAELARHAGRRMDALDGYDRAIAGARAAGLPWEEAISLELSAAYHDGAGRRYVAHGMLWQAKSIWEGFGASRRVRRLEERVSQHLVESAPLRLASRPAPAASDRDLMSVVRAAQALSAETDPARVMASLMHVLLESSGATLGALLMASSSGLRELAWATAEEGIAVHPVDRPVQVGVASVRVVSLVRRSMEVVVVSDARRDARFRDDVQLKASGGRSVLGMPLLRQGELAGVLYLENRVAEGVFTESLVELIRILCSQAVISLENSRLLGELRQHQEDLEQLVRERTRALVRAEKQTAALLDNLADGVITIDEEGIIEGFSAVASQMFGYSSSEVIGRPVEAVVPDFGREDVSGTGVEGPSGVQRLLSERGRRKDGSEFPVEIAVAEVQLEEHRLFSGVVRDMTTQLAAAARLEAARKQAEEANVAKSVFLASMSHEIRTPLNAVLGFAQLLRRDRSLSTEAQERVELIERAGSHLLMLLNSILEMSKIEAGRVELNTADIELRVLLSDVVNMFRGTATAKGIDVGVDLLPELPARVHCDELKLRQILANLVGNAVKFTDEGGVRLRAESTVDEETIWLRLAVSDTGPGLATSDLARVFEKFAQTADGAARSGTGLGLAISREYAQLMGGDITARSRVGVGSTFEVLVPVVGATQAGSSPVRGERRILGLREGHPAVRVLLVDDLDDNRRFLSDLLGGVGIEVKEACDGKEALAVLDDWLPSLVLTDLRMPQMDGWELIARIRERPDGDSIPIVAVSASVIDTVEQDIIAAGASDYITKPVRASEVFGILEALCGVHFEVDEESEAQTAPLKEPAAEVGELPESIRLALVDAAVHIELDRLERLVDELELPGLARRIRALMDDFDYDRIATLLGGDPDVD